MSRDEKPTYNGWSNYETWAVHLWLTNEEGTYRRWTERTSVVLEETSDAGLHSARSRLADEIREEVEDRCRIEGATLSADMMNAALSRVDWCEVAQEFIDDRGGPQPIQGVLFSLGMVVATPGALEELTDVDRTRSLARHARGDWGDICPDDWAENERSVKDGGRLLSVYRSGAGIAFWVITEADRSATTILLPSEY